MAPMEGLLDLAQAPTPIQQALDLPRGAEFRRCALQVNPHHYANTYRGQAKGATAAEHARGIVEKALELDIEVLAITDHNHVGGIAEFRAAAEGNPLHVFPGFELASSEGVHVLCIYPPELEQGQLERLLGEFGIRDTTLSPDLTKSIANKRFVEVVKTVRQQGGVAIAAHVTTDGGLFRQLEGQTRIQAWRSPDLLAVQIPGPIDDLPQHVRSILRNKDREYARPHPAGDDVAVAAVNAKDITCPADLDDHSASCWIKMSEVSIEGLRQAFLDPVSRIRLHPKNRPPEAEKHAELVALVWTGGFLDGSSVRFNPNLNVLIGGRGAGKSTVIESIRAVLGLDPIGDDARKAHDGIVRHVLRSGTKISLLVRVHRPAERTYLIERTLPNPPVVREAPSAEAPSGAVSHLMPAEVLHGLEVFGQHEISELAKSREKRTRLLDRFVERDDAAPHRKEDLLRDLEGNRRDLLDATAELQRIDERLAGLAGLEETLKAFREAGLEEKLRDKSLLIREERLLESVRERLAPLRECAERLAGELPMDRAFVSEKALAELPGKEILARLDNVLVALEGDLGGVARNLDAALRKADAGIETVRGEWTSRKEAVENEYQGILRGLQQRSVDGEDFIRLQRQIEDLRPLRERRPIVERAVEEHTGRRRNLLVDWEDFKADAVRRLRRAAKKVNTKLRNRVEIKVTSSGNRESLFELLRDDVGGRLSEAIECLRKQEDLSLSAFVGACRQGANAVQQTYGIPPSQATSIASAAPEVLMRVEELELPAILSIRLNTAPAGEAPTWQALEELSTGQKATAVLLLLLLESEVPLLVDQPEDDLDNRFITEGIVPRMREEKQRRQFLFSTHNANIPVLGDAELILGLSAKGEAEGGRARITPEHMGSIDSQAVRELVEELLEGGKAAFERRRQKYGF